MMSSKCTCLYPVILACIAGAVIYTAVQPKQVPAPSELGVSAFVMHCAPKDNHRPECGSVAAIQATYKFDLMTEIEAIRLKMKKTAADIAGGHLTDDAYATCLAAGTCASVPMLGKADDPKSAEGRKVSKTFWHLVEGNTLTPDICALIQICDIGFRNGALAVSKNKIVPARVHKS